MEAISKWVSPFSATTDFFAFEDLFKQNLNIDKLPVNPTVYSRHATPSAMCDKTINRRHKQTYHWMSNMTVTWVRHPLDCVATGESLKMSLKPDVDDDAAAATTTTTTTTRGLAWTKVWVKVMHRADEDGKKKVLFEGEKRLNAAGCYSYSGRIPASGILLFTFATSEAPVYFGYISEHVEVDPDAIVDPWILALNY